MGRIVKGGLIQCSNPLNDLDAGVDAIRKAMHDKHIPLIEEAGKQGVQILCLQELYNAPYFCPSQDSVWCNLTETVPGPSVEELSVYAKKYADSDGFGGFFVLRASRTSDSLEKVPTKASINTWTVEGSVQSS